jgi:branched-chain amino acid transport system ATP-binding protein
VTITGQAVTGQRSPQGNDMDTQSVLTLSNVTAGYDRTVVLRDVSVDVPAGQIVALLGPNGAGKTTLLRTASGLLHPMKGTVHINGLDQTSAAPNQRARNGLCLIPEGRGIFRSLSVRENLRIQTPTWVKGDEAKSAMDAALDAFPVLKERQGQIAGSMSGGQQQMLALARSYLSSPKVVLLDEVSMGLAPKIVDEIFVSLQQLASTGVALLLVEQYVNRALEMADKVILLDRGQVEFDGPPSELEQDAVLRGYLGVDLEAEQKADKKTAATAAAAAPTAGSAASSPAAPAATDAPPARRARRTATPEQ